MGKGWLESVGGVRVGSSVSKLLVVGELWLRRPVALRRAGMLGMLGCMMDVEGLRRVWPL